MNWLTDKKDEKLEKVIKDLIKMMCEATKTPFTKDLIMPVRPGSSIELMELGEPMNKR